MALDEYKRKRTFNKTPEPTGGVSDEGQLKFVVQKHAASHLHYDFRLELKGILKSWAVPKGPSLNPDDRRLAMLTEDHPYDYKDFEGIIPKGQYGGGTVIVWDEGAYDTPMSEEKDKKSLEHSLTGQFYKGEMLVNLSGQKLKGKFAIIRDGSKGDNSWYLIKVKDEHAVKTDITKKDKSVISGLTIDEMAANPDAKKWQSNRAGEGDNTATQILPDRDLLKKGIKSPLLPHPEAMNCTLIREPFNDAGWLYEVKLDGYRILASKKGNDVTLHSRKSLNYTRYYPSVVQALKEIPFDAIVDGELVVLDEKGRPNFDLLQKYHEGMPIAYYCFDLLWVGGYDITGLFLTERKALLKQLMPQNEVIRYSDGFDDGLLLFEQIKAMDLEGIVAKRKDSKYQPGKRVKDWLKLPTEIRQEFVIGGWTESDSGRPFRSIVFGAYEEGSLRFVGHSGSGFKDEVMKEVMKRLKPLETKKNPFADEVDHTTTPHWVKPELVGNFKFSTWTAAGKIRKPAIFLGFRDDKDPKEVVREIALTPKQEEKVVHEMAKPIEKVTITQMVKSEPEERQDRPLQGKKENVDESNWPELDKQLVTSSAVFSIEDRQVTLTNVEKELWPGIKKAHLIQYYHEVSRFLMPYLLDRPQSLHVKHLKPTAPGLYIKDMEGRQPGWADIFSVNRKHKKKGKREVIDYLVCNNEATLLYMVNLGCIDINPWTSRTASYLQPDFIIIDLDPSDEDFKKVIETARAAKQFFDQHKLRAFPKTSGKTGMHFYLQRPVLSLLRF